jgi:hypothetical protein
MGKSNAGRHWFDGKDFDLVVTKLEQAWALGCSDVEASLVAGISTGALCRFLKSHPDIAKRKEQLKETPVLEARNALYKQIKKGDGALALKYLERKKKKEFSVLHEFKDNTPPAHDLSDVSTEVLKQMRDLWQAAKKK